MKTTDQKRADVADWITDAQTQDCYDIGRARVIWVADAGEFLLIGPDGENIYDDGFNIINLIDDQDINDFYPKIAEYYEDTE